MNLVIIIGRLGQDPTMRYTPSGYAVTTFSVAANHVFRNGNGDREERTEWVRVVAWRKLAEICNQYLAKGRLVAVVGRLQTRAYQDESGTTHYRTEVLARSVRILDRPREPAEIEAEDEEEEAE